MNCPARALVTSNAAGNAAMLRINQEFGYRLSAAEMTWQISVERARSYLATRTNDV